MAAKDLDIRDIRDVKKQEELEDISTCCICTEVYTDPKALPCIHTFCMKCLQENGLKTSKGPGDEMPCPICRRLFKIPLEGFRGLPKHFFIERLIQLSKDLDPSAASIALCFLCSEESKEHEGKEGPIADTYCVDCKCKLCHECCSEHQTFKATKKHKLISINEYENGQNALPDLPPLICNVHEQRALDVFCADCNIVLCAMCFIEKHNNHKGFDVNKCVDGYRKQIQSDTETLIDCISQAQVKKVELMKAKEEIQKLAESIECDIVQRREELKQSADKQTSRLLHSLCSETQSRLKEIQIGTDDIDAYISNLENYNSYCQRIMAKGSASDICSALSDLSVRASELQQQCQPIIERVIHEFKLYFRQSELEDLLEEDRCDLIGELEKESVSKPKIQVKHDLLAEQRKEIDILRNQNEDLRKEGADYNAQTEELKQELENNKTVIKALQTSNDKEKADYKAHMEKLMEDLKNNEIAINALQTSKDTEKDDYKAQIEKVKQELKDNEITTNALHVSNNKLKQELYTEKSNNNSLPSNNYKLLEVELRYISYPVLVHTFRTKASEEEKKWSAGLTILDKELFVVSQSSSYVDVYDKIKLSFSRRLKLKEVIDPWDIVSCNRKECLYIVHMTDSITKSTEILRVDPNGKSINNWSTAGVCHRLSVTHESNIISAVCRENKLNEYSPDGQLLRQIKAGIHWPWHAIKLTSGHFVVGHGIGNGNLHRVCIVDADGKLQKSFGASRGSTIGQLNEPWYLAVDVNGFVMVVDRRNSRVLLLDSDLEFKGEIFSKERHGLRDPWRILLDESNGRLFVAENELKKERIIVFDLVKPIQ